MRALDLCTLHSVKLSIVLSIPRGYLALLLQPTKSTRDKCLTVRPAAVSQDVVVHGSICVDGTPGSITLAFGHPDDMAAPKEVRGLHVLVPRLIGEFVFVRTPSASDMVQGTSRTLISLSSFANYSSAMAILR